MPLIDADSPAPRFSLQDQDGRNHDLKDYVGRTVVLFFYPKDDTPGCTVEACQFRDHLPDFRKIKAVVLGISPDDSESHAKFASKHDLNFTLLADRAGPDGRPATCAAYGVLVEKSMFGKPYTGVIRTTYLIDAGGKVVRRWDRVNEDGHATEVLEAVRELEGVPPAGHRKPQRKGRGDSNPPFSGVARVKGKKRPAGAKAATSRRAASGRRR